MKQDGFYTVGAGWRTPPAYPPEKPRRGRFPLVWTAVLAVILLGCAAAGWIVPGDARYLDLAHAGLSPRAGFWFGTDTLGRDLFAMIWHGGRVSLLIGLLAAGISTTVAAVIGTFWGLTVGRFENLLTRGMELLLSLPSILLAVFLQAALGQAGPLSIACVIGATGWMGMARLVRGEVRTLSESGYVLAARCMNASFWEILRRHLLPNFWPAILYMSLTSVGSAIAAEATLSFLGVGLPPEAVSWGSLLAQADSALLSNQWWLIVVPGLFLTAVLVGLAELGNYLRREGVRGCSYLTQD